METAQQTIDYVMRGGDVSTVTVRLCLPQAELKYIPIDDLKLECSALGPAELLIYYGISWSRI